MGIPKDVLRDKDKYTEYVKKLVSEGELQGGERWVCRAFRDSTTVLATFPGSPRQKKERKGGEGASSRKRCLSVT